MNLGFDNILDLAYTLRELRDIYQEVSEDPSLPNIEDGVAAFVDAAYPLTPKKWKRKASEEEIKQVLEHGFGLVRAVPALFH